MLQPKSTVHLARRMAEVAMSAMLLGALLIGATNWQVPGWVMVTYGVLVLFLAYHVSAAPCMDEPEPEVRIKGPYSTNADCKEKLEELTAEALAGYRI